MFTTLPRSLSVTMLAGFVLLLLPALSFAQADIARANDDPNAPLTKAPATRSDSDVAHKLELLEEQLRAQSGRIDQLTALIAEQQRLINQLVGTRNSSAPATLTDATATAAAPANASTVSTKPQNPVEDRLKKVEERVTRFGPFRFSGDFRIRFDGTFRRAEPNPPAGFAPLTHVQNARMRYRLRF